MAKSAGFGTGILQANTSTRTMKMPTRALLVFRIGRWQLAAAVALLLAAIPDLVYSQQTAGKKPNILVIMGDDIGWFNPSCYNRGLMSYETPNIDRIEIGRAHV